MFFFGTSRALGGGEPGVPPFGYPSNSLYLQIDNITAGQMYLNLYNATGLVYVIYSRTNAALTTWNIEQEVWPTDPAVMPFAVSRWERESLYVLARDWTGVTEHGNTTPDWWFWKYFRTVALFDTNRDSNGNTLLSDYQNGVDPTVFNFALSVANSYVSNIIVLVQLNLIGVAPGYVAVAVDNAVNATSGWQTYSGTNLAVNLGRSNGWHDVWVGLRGAPPEAPETWQLIRLNLNLPSPAVNWYVRAGAPGAQTGVDWDNAWTNTTGIDWSIVQPGDSIWIAGGTYHQLVIGKGGTPGNPIYIARVRTTNAVPAAAVGWNSSFDSTVVLHTVKGTDGVSDWTLDGQVPYGGIVITNPAHGPVNAIELGNIGPENNISLMNLDNAGWVQYSDGGDGTDARGLNFNFENTTACSNLYVGGCRFHNYNTLVSGMGMTGAVFEHNRFYNNFNGGTGDHPNVIQTGASTNWVFRYNEVSNWIVEGIMLEPNGGAAGCGAFWIYGNVWHDPVPDSNARCLESQNTANGPVYLFNNTFVNLDFVIFNAGSPTNWAGGGSTNNIVYNCPYADPAFNGNHDYNLTSNLNDEPHGIAGVSSDIFVSYATTNYSIVGTVGPLYPKDKGANLGPPFNVDFKGSLRGADGFWDIGAYEKQ